MPIKSSGSPLALAGSRKKGTEATTTAGGIDITGTDITEEFGHKGSDQAVVGTNIKLGDYIRGDLVPDVSANSAIKASKAGGSNLQMGNYYEGVDTFMDSSFNTPLWQTTLSHNATFGFPEAWCYMQFLVAPANNQINVTYAWGTSAAPGNYYTVYVDYSGLTAFQVRYNATSQNRVQDAAGNCFQGAWGATPVQDGYNAGTYYSLNSAKLFGWMAKANPNQPPCNGFARVEATIGTTSLPAFQIQGAPTATDLANGTNVFTSDWSSAIALPGQPLPPPGSQYNQAQVTLIASHSPYAVPF